MSDELKETGRVEAFSDGVFAIAITLLVLDIKVPRELPADVTLAAALMREWPSYLAFVTSFATILISRRLPWPLRTVPRGRRLQRHVHRHCRVLQPVVA
jgi:Endosomal/lysosomal potassium channel TMEM175